MGKLKIGIIGTGNIAQQHASGYQLLEDVEIVACCDLNRDRAEEFAKRNNIPAVYASYDEMLAKAELDAVSVTTWNNAHMPASVAALNAGKHVLVEKPMAMNAEEGRIMKEAAEKNGKLLMIGFVRRFDPKTDIAKEYIESGEVGDIYYAKTKCTRRCGNPLGWFADKSLSGGGPLIDLGVHMIDLARYLMGKPCAVSVYGVTANKIGPMEDIKHHSRYLAYSAGSGVCDVEDFATAIIRFDNGAALHVEVSFSGHIAKEELSLEILGAKGGMTINPDLALYTVKHNLLVDETPRISVATDTFSNIFSLEIAHFVDCVKNGTPCRNTADDGIALMEILDAIYKSAETGREVLL